MVDENLKGGVIIFQIRYRITENIHYLKSLDEERFDKEGDFEGFFYLNFDGNEYGYCHDNPLREQERGSELLTNWFMSLLKALLAIQNTQYVAISDIESFNTWIEMKKNGEDILVSIVEAPKEDGSFEIQTTPLKNSKYGDWSNAKLDMREFQDELISRSKQYLSEIIGVNPKLQRSTRLITLNELISQANNLLE